MADDKSKRGAAAAAF